MQKGSERTESAASKMLAAALQQMDGIISGAAMGGVGSGNGSAAVTQPSITKDNHDNFDFMPTMMGSTIGGNGAISLSERNLISATNVITTAKTLAIALQQVGVAAPTPDPVTAAIISDWLETHITRQDTDERLRRMQRDNESLTLQYQMLAERVSEQADKILELEGLLTEKAKLLSQKEEQLQRQILLRSAWETQKLELMTALSELKLHRTALERENAGVSGHRMPGYGSMGNLHLQNTNFSIACPPKTPPSVLRHQIQAQFHSLPRPHNNNKNTNNNNQTNITNNNNNNNNNSNRAVDANANAPPLSPKARNVAFASNEKILIEDNESNDLMSSSFVSQTNSTSSPKMRERSIKGLRNIFGKLRRSNSGNLELPTLEQYETEFKRGGARATTSGRIEWHTKPPHTKFRTNYTEWSPQDVCNWLVDIGLGCYEDDCRKWLKQHPSLCIFKAAPQDIEKELNLKSPLHRKKILLAIDEITGREEDEQSLKAAQLDITWITRWLDDIGLPQYKEAFVKAKFDGRMLHRLTMEDLQHLHITSCLHIASLRRGIQCMREMNWNPECLIRRSIKSSSDDGTIDESDYIVLWTAYRVMEWLRVVDLSEYAPNLRGAGVHGALMLYEQRFNENLLADLLSIPPSKSLLRRHLATHFKELLGRNIIQSKRDAEAIPGYQPLTITSKVKTPKKSQFSLKRRKSTKSSNGSDGITDWSAYVCPMFVLSGGGQMTNNSSTTSSSTSTNNSSSRQSN